jgi:flagellar hook protein FlgE
MAFIAALGALRAHQDWLDVIGNNLANSNTPGYKSSRATFSDLISVTKRQGTAPTGSIGGTNPMQIGLGVQLASVDRQFSQGALDITGRRFDLALLGRGFFALADGANTLYSRVGAFGLDSAGNLVDLRSGNQVLAPNGSAVTIDTTAVLPPQATSQVSFSGNLPAQVTGPLAEELTSSSAYMEGTAALMTGGNSGPFPIPAGETWTMELVINGGAPQEVSIAGTGAAVTAQQVVDEINAQTDDVVASVSGGAVELVSERSGDAASIQVVAGQAGKDLKGLVGLGDFVQGTETVATPGTDLNALSTNVSDYQTGDQIQVVGTDVDGTPLVASFAYGVDGTTVGELTSFLDATFGQSTVAFDTATGRISVTADTAGEAELSLSITDGANQAGRSDWASGFFSVTTNGAGPDVVTSSLEVFDAAGTPHVLTVDFTRQADGTWNLDASVPPAEGNVTSGTISGVTFNENGSILTPSQVQISAQFGGGSAQTIDLDLGTSGSFDGLTMFGTPASVVANFQDGFTSGELADLGVLDTGRIEGYYTNGQSQILGAIGIANFTNQEALEEVGDSFFRTTANTGDRVMTAGNTGPAGEVVGGALESSNVETSEEFVRLIQAQRGFQANARVITVQDELLAEVVNVV